MAILKNLLVTGGASRFLGSIYCQDISVSGTATLSSLSLSGDLSVTGTSTLSGHVSVGGYNNTSYGLSANSAIINNWIRTAGSTGWYNESHGGGWWMKDNDYVRSYGKPVLMDHNIYFGTAGDSGYYVKTTGAAKFASVAAPAATISTISATNLSVSNNLRATHFDLQTVAQLGGSFYVSPTVKFPNSGTTLKVEKSGSTLTLTITDSSITSTTMAGVVWSANSRVKVSGTINGVVTGTMDGTVSSINTGSHTLTLSVSGENSGSVQASPSGSPYTASQFSDLSVMVYQRRDGSNDYRVGIWMNCYDVANSSSTIRIYGGSDANPNVMLGNLTSAGLGTVNNLTPTGWGLFAQNAFLHGKVVANGGLIGNWTIGESSMYYSSDAPSNSSIVLAPGGETASVNIGGSGTSQKSWVFTVKNLFGVDTSGALYSSSGKIGGWNIGTSSLYNTTNSMTSTGVGLYLGTDGIRNYSSGTQYVNITSGKITALGVDVSGKITATSGAIGGFDITSTAIKTKDVAVTSNADNSISLSSADFTRTINSTSREGLRFAIGDKFGVTGDGTIYAGSANISGTLTAGNGSKIGDLTIANGKLSVPAANITGTLSADHIDTSSITIGQSQVDGLSTALGNKANSSTVTALSNKVTAVYGTCDTAANTQVKNVTCSNFEYYDGALITVAFSTANTYNVSTIRLNVNSKGQKNIKVANVITAADNCLLWGAGAVITFRYDGDYFVVVGEPRTWYGASTTAANTYVKTDTTAVTGCVICKGTVVSLSMQHDNTATTPLLNIAGTGNIELYAGNGTTTRPTTSNGLGWTAGSTAQFIFDGQYWRVGDTAGLARAYSAQSTANTANTNATNAAKTATNFITADGTNGIKIHNTSNTTDYVQILSDGTHIYKGGNNVATFGETAVIGNMSARGVSIDTNGFKFNNNGEQNFFIGIDNRQAETITSGNATVTNSSSYKTIDNIKYYRVASIPSGVTVVSVVGTFESAVENGEEVVFTAVDENVSHWTVNNGYLWVEDGYSSYSQFEETIKYSYTTQANSNLPYMVFGTSAYEDDIIAGVNSFAQGYKNKALGSFSTALGSSTVASGTSSFACGINTVASGEASFTCGVNAVASGGRSIAMGINSVASGDRSTSIGSLTTASEECSIAIGVGSRASGVHSTAIGNNGVNASGNYSTAIGINSFAQGICSTAIGCSSQAYSDYSVAIGNSTMAYTAHSVAIGNNTTASGIYSTAIGYHTTASGSYSTTMGVYTIANKRSQTAIGRYNVEDTTPSSAVHPGGTEYGHYAFIIGNGTNDDNRSNAFTVDWAGNVWAAGSVRTENDNIDNALLTAQSPFGIMYCNARKVGGFIFFSLELVINSQFVSNYPYVFATIASDYVPKNDIEVGIGFNTDGSYNPKGIATWRAYNNGNIDFILQSTGGPYVFLSGFYAYE